MTYKGYGQRSTCFPPRRLTSCFRWMRKWGWRNVYILCIALNAIFSILQVLLIFRINISIGIPDFIFALGDEGVLRFILGLQFLPITIMMVHLCPTGSEGVSYGKICFNSNYQHGALFVKLVTRIYSDSNVHNRKQRGGDFVVKPEHTTATNMGCFES